MAALVLAISVNDGTGAPPVPAASTPATDRAEERALLDEARGGDLQAFEQLYRRNVRRVHALCWRLAGDGTAAEELVQETFVRAWSNLAGFRGDSSFSSWLHRLAVNLALDERRARSRGLAALTVSSGDLEGESGGAAGPPGQRASGPELSYDLERALRALPPRARAVFVLHDIEGHLHEEIAVMMDVDPGTSKSQLHRARKLLREALR